MPGAIDGDAATGNPPLVPVPDIPLQLYYNEALRNGMVFEGPYEGGGSNMFPGASELVDHTPNWSFWFTVQGSRLETLNPLFLQL